jgi:succinoglycan biosynthesis protein ExoO
LQNSTSPVVSIVTAAYNAEAFLSRAVESALAQSGLAIELIVVDDGSTDNTFALASRFAETDDRVRPIRLPTNSGPATARNTGIDAARGAWIGVLDADDAMLEGRLAAMVETGNREKLDIVADNFWFWDMRTQSATETAFAPGIPFKIVSIHEYLGNTQASFASTDWGLLKPIFRRDFLRRKNLSYPPAARHGEDFLFMVSCLLEGARFGLLGEPGYLYTMRTSGVSRTSLDYAGLITQCQALLRDERISGDRSLAKLVRGRITGVRSVAAHHHCYRMLDLHAYKKIAFELFWNVDLWRALLRDPGLRREVLGVVKRKLQKTIRGSGNH